jgi:hypothetical protein
MITEFVERFETGKEQLRASFAKEHPGSYKDVVINVLTILKGDEEYGRPDPEKVTEIDNGDYQGTLVYVIPEGGYQPSTYWYVKVGYGSCSGCDTLEAIRGYEDGAPSAKQVDDYMTLALHIVQGIKVMGDEA